MNFYPNKNIKRFYLRGELSAVSLKTNTSFGEQQGNYREERHRTSQVVLSFNPTLVYNIYNRPLLRWFAGLGPGVSLHLFRKNDYTKTVGPDTYPLIPPSLPNQVVFAATASSGLTFKDRFQLSLNFDATPAIVSYTTYAVHQRTSGVTFHYYIR